MQQAVALEPGDPLSHQWLTMSLLRSGRAQDAVAPITEAVRLDPRNPRMPYLCILGMANLAAGNYEEALDAFERDERAGIRRGPYVYAMQAAAYAMTEREDRARAMMPQLNRDIESEDISVAAWLQPWFATPEAYRQILETLADLGMTEPGA